MLLTTKDFITFKALEKFLIKVQLVIFRYTYLM